MLGGELLASFITAYPQVEVDITVTDEEFDIVGQGYDAGVRLGEVIAQDMIAVPVSNAQRQVAVASPAYLARAGTPQHPQDLVNHRCIGWRKGPGLALIAGSSQSRDASLMLPSIRNSPPMTWG